MTNKKTRTNVINKLPKTGHSYNYRDEENQPRKPQIFTGYEVIFKNRQIQLKNRGGGIAKYIRKSWE